MDIEALCIRLIKNDLTDSDETYIREVLPKQWVAIIKELAKAGYSQYDAQNMINNRISGI